MFTFFRKLKKLNEIDHKLDLIIDLLISIKETEYYMSKEMDDLAAVVARNTTVVASAVALIQGLADKIAASAGNAEMVMELTNQLSDSADALAAAVVANTPAEPTPVEPVVEEPVVEEPVVEEPVVEVPVTEEPTQNN